MKTSFLRTELFSVSVFRMSMFAAAALLAEGAAEAADDSFAATGWLASVPVPGIVFTNAAGQAYFKGNVHFVRLESDNLRVAGRLQAMPEVAFQADGTHTFTGTGYDELGIWEGTNFTASRGVWELSYRGVTRIDGSVHYDMTGIGVGGSIDGLRFQAQVSRAAGPSFDYTLPYSASGFIRPKPVNIRLVVDNFNDNKFTWTRFGAGTGQFTAVPQNGQLTIQGRWHDATFNVDDTAAWANPDQSWSISAGKTIEVRVDLVRMNQFATAAGIALYHTTGQAYVFVAARAYTALGKQYLPGHSWFSVDKAAVRDTNVVLTLSLTPVGKNLVVIGRVLEGDQGTVLAQSSFIDTPASDRTFTAAQIAQVTAGRTWHDTRADPAGAPWTDGSAPLILVYQETDGTLPQAEGTFDNLELRTCEVPQAGIEAAIRLTWPATGINYSVQGSRNVSGPWLPPVTGTTAGLEQFTVPAQGDTWFFRLLEAP